MYRINKNILMMSLILMVTILSSCKNPHDSLELTGDVSKYFPTYCVDLDVISSSMDGNVDTLTCTPTFYFEPEKWGMRIEKVEYFVDDTYCQTETESPYEFMYMPTGWIDMEGHAIRADITITGDKIDTFVFQCTKVLTSSISTSSSKSRKADIWTDFGFATTGEEWFISASVNKNRSEGDVTLTSFAATWDDEYMGEATSEPFKLTTLITDDVATMHNITGTIKYTLDKTQYTSSYTMSYEVPAPTSVRLMFRLKSNYTDYENGEYLEGIARPYIGSEVKKSYALELYLDDKHIGGADSFPYSISYLLENLEVGDHTITSKWICYDENGDFINAYSSDQVITITK
jgi:hypothetical protein